MRVLLVTWVDQLLEKLSILSPELEYCAIVTDEVEVAKEILDQANLPKIPLYPFYDMKECLKDFYYDYVLCVENQWWQSLLADKVQKYDVPKEKILNFCGLTFSNNFHIEIALRYYKEHAEEFEIFATGISSFHYDLSKTLNNSRLDARDGIDAWNKKLYPETRDENIKILDDYLTLCEKNNIRPIMFLAPVTEGYMKHFNKRILDEFYYLVEKACMKHPGSIFLDGWKILGLTDADFFDVSHMNIYGAARFSAFLNDFIEGLER